MNMGEGKLAQFFAEIFFTPPTHPNKRNYLIWGKWTSFFHGKCLCSSPEAIPQENGSLSLPPLTWKKKEKYFLCTFPKLTQFPLSPPKKKQCNLRSNRLSSFLCFTQKRKMFAFSIPKMPSAVPPPPKNEDASFFELPKAVWTVTHLVSFFPCYN